MMDGRACLGAIWLMLSGLLPARPLRCAFYLFHVFYLGLCFFFCEISELFPIVVDFSICWLIAWLGYWLAVLFDLAMTDRNGFCYWFVIVLTMQIDMVLVIGL